MIPAFKNRIRPLWLVAVIGTALLLLTFLLVGHLALHAEKREREKLLARESASYQTAFESTQVSMEQSMLTLSTLIASDPTVRQLLQGGRAAWEREGGGSGGPETARLRVALHEYLAPRWQTLQAQFGLRQLHFHFDPALTSFLRVHAPDNHGDELRDIRPLIADVNDRREPLGGFETGCLASGIRGAVPVSATHRDGAVEHIGVLEVGTSFDAQLPRIEGVLNAMVGVFLKAPYLEGKRCKDAPPIHDWPAFEHGAYLEAASQPGIRALFEQTALPFDTADQALYSSVQRLDGRDWHVTVFPLRDHLGTLDPQRSDVGWVVIWHEIGDLVADWRQQEKQTIAALSGAFLISLALLLGGIGFAHRAMRSRITQATADLQEANQRLRHAQRVARLGIWECHVPSQSLYWSPQTYRLFGLPPDTEIDKAMFARFVHPDDRADLDQRWNAALDGAPFEIEFRIIVNDQVRWVREVADLRLDEQGKLLHALGTIQDITPLKEAEQALRASEERYRNTFAAVEDGVWDWDVPSGKVWWDDRCYEMLGYPPRHFDVNLAVWQSLLHPEDARPATEAVFQQLKQGKTFRIEFRFQCRDKTWLWIQGRGKVIAWSEDGQPLRLTGTHTDITERKQAELALKALSHRQALLLESASEGIYGVDPAGHITFVNAAALQMLGHEESELLGAHSHRAFHHHRPDGETYAEQDCPIQKTLEDETPRRIPNEWFIRKNGDFFPVEMAVAPIHDDGALKGAVVLFQDNSARRDAEQALENERTRLATVIENFHGGVLLENQSRHVELVNDAFRELFEIPETPEFLVGQRGHLALLADSDRLAHPDSFKSRLQEILDKREAVTGEEVRLADGRTLERDYLPIQRNGHFLGHLWIYRDITERKLRELELHRLATRDTLTGIPNRHYFMERLEQELSRFHRFRKPVALLMLDIDHFKQVNDHFGHAAGDAVLCHMANTVQGCKRRIDLFGRLGGEEFAMILPGTQPEGAQQFADRLREAIAARPAFHDDTPIPITVSIGVTLFETGDASIERILSRADDALYRAKHAGRNRTRCSW